jgi:hypothetical protein
VTAAQSDQAIKNPIVKSSGIVTKGGYGRHIPVPDMPPLPAVATQSIRDTPVTERLAERQETTVEQYMVFAKDGKNETETNQTQQFLENLVGEENIEPPFILLDELRYWACTSKLI